MRWTSCCKKWWTYWHCIFNQQKDGATKKWSSCLPSFDFLNCNYSPIFENFSVLFHENKVPFRTEISLLIMSYQLIKTYVPPFSISYSEFLSHCLLHSGTSVINFFSYFTSLFRFKEKLYIFNYQYVKWFDNKQMKYVRNVPSITFLKNWTCRKKLLSLCKPRMHIT